MYFITIITMTTDDRAFPHLYFATFLYMQTN